ncbi:response regulator with CheY-like receiver domain and winged-helix DNA-binding domain [Desulfitobacterium dichloroeliminans LMG P-21439]|uniref:Stage 0 sporulation protein A homolog n=1 Tax=Desulfitobacterium dichloroeliminans (strain LMG P-21439 / DCA1) TaxID=871963 RepID=L0F7B6_DESDL|nr:response regulator transcription factor [Desulfitobacterium dichloroeliminans]AGA68526.1 response regulator with CheY-like receiver domain and winged-helix DNA-binding domain [Desulfitobacterium dichloroeliminans LMG P-21439]
MKCAYKILLVDDEESIYKVVEQVLRRDACELIYADNGEVALECFQSENPDLIILDVMLPLIDGYEVCKTIRETSRVPILMLSAKGEIIDKSVGFNLGADDYLVKPFSPVELGLRIKALLRRTFDKEQVPPNVRLNKEICHGDLVIKCESHEVFVRGKPIYLTPKEFELLSFMAEHPAHVFTREQLFAHLWEDEYASDTSTITVFIRKLREKIECDPSKPQYIQTVWGIGYKYCE